MSGVVEKEVEVGVVASPDEDAWANPDGSDDAVVRALGAAAGPRLRVVRGQPDEVEIAALVAGIAGAATGGAGAAVPSRWTDHRRRLGLPPVPGADAWRWSGR